MGHRAAASPDYTIRAVERVCDLLDLMQEASQGTSLAEAALRADLPKSSALRYLATLGARRYVEHHPADGTYRLGPAILPLRARQLDVLADQLRPCLQELSAASGETASWWMQDGTGVLCGEASESSNVIRFAVNPGDRAPLHATAEGKAIAAELDETHVRSLLEQGGMLAVTDRTITDPDRFMAELAEVRVNGYAVDDGESNPDVRVVAVAIRGTSVQAALGIGAPSIRMPRDRIEAFAVKLAERASQALARNPIARG